MGTGETLIGFDAHIDTVGIGNRDNWTFDPYEGYETETEIGGRGVSDQCGGIVSAVYGAKIMKDLELLSDKYTVLVTGTVQEEDCDGLCWQYIINEDKYRPAFVVSTEPTDGGIYRGQRGRMEIRVDVKGVSCHGSAPERGDNAIYKMADILLEIRALNEMAENRGQSLAQMALSWILRRKEVTSVLIGASSVAQLEDNIKALDGPVFTKEEQEAIDRILADS